MKVEFDSSFHKSLIKIKDKALLNKVRLIIEHAEQADGVYDIPHIKKMKDSIRSIVHELVIIVLVLN